MQCKKHSRMGLKNSVLLALFLLGFFVICIQMTNYYWIIYPHNANHKPSEIKLLGHQHLSTNNQTHDYVHVARTGGDSMAVDLFNIVPYVEDYRWFEIVPLVIGMMIACIACQCCVSATTHPLLWCCRKFVVCKWRKRPKRKFKPGSWAFDEVV